MRVRVNVLTVCRHADGFHRLVAVLSRLAVYCFIREGCWQAIRDRLHAIGDGRAYASAEEVTLGSTRTVEWVRRFLVSVPPCNLFADTFGRRHKGDS